MLINCNKIPGYFGFYILKYIWGYLSTPHYEVKLIKYIIIYLVKPRLKLISQIEEKKRKRQS